MAKVAKSVEKTYNAKQFGARMGKMKEKFNDTAANVSAEVFQKLPDGTYTCQIKPAVFKETKNKSLMVRIQFVVIDGDMEKRRDEVTTFIDENRCYEDGDLAGVPYGLVDVTRTAKNLGIETTDSDGTAKDFAEILEELETICEAEPNVTVLCSTKKYTPQKGPNAGKEQTAYNRSITGLVDGGDSDDAEESEEDTEDAEAEDEAQEVEPSFAVGDKVKYKVGRVVHTCTVKKVHEDGTYNIQGADKKPYNKIAEDDLTAV